MTAATTARDIVELLEPVLRGGVRYAAGHQFERLLSTARQHVCRDSDGRRVILPREAVRLVKAHAPDAAPAPKTVADLVRLGLVKPLAGGAA